MPLNDHAQMVWNAILSAYPGYHEVMEATGAHFDITNCWTFRLRFMPTGDPTIDHGSANALDVSSYTAPGVPYGLVLDKAMTSESNTTALIRRVTAGIYGNAVSKLYGAPIWRHKEWQAVWNHYP